LRVPICQVDRLADVMQSLRSEHGVEFWATVTDASATAFDKAPRPARLALLLGSEGHGLSPQWLERCDRRVTIPMQPGVDSLNVAVAAGIMLYHFTRSS
jgi:TrmH family RNA methyltransferase